MVKTSVKTTRLGNVTRADAEVFAAEARMTGAEAWVVYTCGKKSAGWVLTVRTHEIVSDMNAIGDRHDKDAK